MKVYKNSWIFVMLLKSCLAFSLATFWVLSMKAIKTSGVLERVNYQFEKRTNSWLEPLKRHRVERFKTISLILSTGKAVFSLTIVFYSV